MVILEGARALVDRGREHLAEFVARYDAFHRSGLGNRFERLDPVTGGKVWGTSVTRVIPMSATVVLYDVVNTLRSALDHAVYEASVRLGHPDPTNTQFPFGDDATQVAARIGSTRKGTGGWFDGIAPELDECLKGIKPHRGPGGDRVLWGLNKLRNIKNHRKMVRLDFHPSHFKLTRGFIFGGGIQIVHEWNAARDEFIYLRSVQPETQVMAQMDLLSIPVFMSVDVLEGRAAIATLHDLIGEIREHIRAVEGAADEALKKRDQQA